MSKYLTLVVFTFQVISTWHFQFLIGGKDPLGWFARGTGKECGARCLLPCSISPQVKPRTGTCNIQESWSTGKANSRVLRRKVLVTNTFSCTFSPSGKQRRRKYRERARETKRKHGGYTNNVTAPLAFTSSAPSGKSHRWKYWGRTRKTKRNHAGYTNIVTALLPFTSSAPSGKTRRRYKQGPAGVEEENER